MNKWKAGTLGLVALIVVLSFFYPKEEKLLALKIESCCIGYRGNVQLISNCDMTNQTVDIKDLTNLIEYLFITYESLCCEKEADIYPLIYGGEEDNFVGIGDITALIDYLFINYPPLPYNLVFSWTTPETAYEYSFKMAQSEDSLTNHWWKCMSLNVPEVTEGGVKETHTPYLNLEEGVTYFFAIRSVNFEGHWSDISNIVNHTVEEN